MKNFLTLILNKPTKEDLTVKNLVRIFSALTMCLSATALHSQGSGVCCEINEPYDVSSKEGFYIGATGVWAVPSETGIGTFTDSWQYLDSDGGVTALSKPSKASYKGAWGLKGGYDFACSGYNVEVEYFHLHNSKHNVNDTSDGPISFGSAFFDLGIPLTPGQAFVSDSHLKYNLDQLDVKIGHRFTACNGNLQLLPSLGVRFVELKHDLTFLVGNVRSKYQGAGPMLSFGGDFQFFNGFFLVGQFDAAALMGSVKANSLLTFGAINRYKSPSTDRIVYAFDGTLALAYQYMFCNQSSIRIDLGYKVASYQDSFDIISAIVEPVPRISNLNTTDFGYSGPFLQLTWHM